MTTPPLLQVHLRCRFLFEVRHLQVVGFLVFEVTVVEFGAGGGVVLFGGVAGTAGGVNGLAGVLPAVVPAFPVGRSPTLCFPGGKFISSPHTGGAENADVAMTAATSATRGLDTVTPLPFAPG